MTDLVEIARGYYELGMIAEAYEELDRLGKRGEDEIEVIRLRVELLIHGKRWDDALAMCQRLCESEPYGEQGFIHAAYCLHEMGRTEDACRFLLAVPAHVREKAIWLYNVGCYQAVLGNRAEAYGFLERSFALDETLRQRAKEDPDLAPLWGELGEEESG